MKYSRAIKKLLADDFAEPPEEIVKHYTKQVYTGSFTQSVREKFQMIVKRAMRDFVNERIESRLTVARDLEDHPLPSGEPTAGAVVADQLPDGVLKIDGDVVTTREELDAYLMVKAIVRKTLAADRVHMRDGKTYCSILADNNNRKPICRLWFNGKSKKYVGLFDADRNETKVEISSLDDLYGLTDQLEVAAGLYA